MRCLSFHVNKWIWNVFLPWLASTRCVTLTSIISYNGCDSARFSFWVKPFYHSCLVFEGLSDGTKKFREFFLEFQKSGFERTLKRFFQSAFVLSFVNGLLPYLYSCLSDITSSIYSWPGDLTLFFDLLLMKKGKNIATFYVETWYKRANSLLILCPWPWHLT